MLRIAALTISASLILFASGCALDRSRLGQHFPNSQALSTTGTYDILPQRTGESSGIVILGFFPVGVENKRGIVHGGANPSGGDGGGFFSTLLAPIRAIFGGGGGAQNAVESAALYNAIESTPGADAIMAPRWHVTTTNYFLWKEIDARVKGKGVRYNVTATQ